MAYPVPFHRMVLSGTIYDDVFNTSLSIVGANMRAVDTTILTAIKDVAQVWFASTGTTGAQIFSCSKLTELKLNRIGTNGKYMDPDSHTWVYPTPINGASTGEAPPQLSAVVSLRTGVDRGLANRGRMYLPPVNGYILPGSDGRVLATAAVRIAGAVSTLINQINTAYSVYAGGGDFGGRVSVVSDRGAGAWHLVTKTTAGRVIDTMRSRRSSLDEDYQASTIPIAGA